MFTHNASHGMLLNLPGNIAVEGNETADNGGWGMHVSNWPGTMTMIGNADLALGLGNKVHDNRGGGIYAYDAVRIVGNAVYGHETIGNLGIQLVGAEASRNVVFDNDTGIWAQEGFITENRIYGNTGAVRPRRTAGTPPSSAT